MSQLRVIDPHKLIEQCDQDEAQIHSEFALLERADFVDFIRNSQQSKAKAPDQLIA